MQFRFALFATFVLVASLTTTAPAAFTTGFEEPTYVSGNISGQDGWSTNLRPETQRVRTASEISDELSASGLNPAAPVHSGNQALLVTGTSGSSSTFRPIAGLASEAAVVLDVFARPLSPPTSDAPTTGSAVGNIFMTMEDSAGVRATAFRFGVTDTATTLDVGTARAGSTVWEPTGLTWAPDVWYNLTMEADYAAKTFDFFVDGMQVNSEHIPFYNTTSADFSQVRIFRGSGQAGMIVDDVSVAAVPEPAGIASLLLAGGAMFVRRRRSRA